MFIVYPVLQDVLQRPLHRYSARFGFVCQPRQFICQRRYVPVEVYFRLAVYSTPLVRVVFARAVCTPTVRKWLSCEMIDAMHNELSNRLALY